MSIATEITRLQNAKADIKTSIEAKGVTVPSSAKLDTYSSYVDQISGGGSSKLPSVIDGSITTLTASDFGNITTIRGSAFEGCTSLTSVTMPNTITTMATGIGIGQGYQFQGCTNLTTVNLSTNLTNISESCFVKCSSLTSIDLSNLSEDGTSNNKSIGQAAFSGCSSLTNITLPSTIGNNFFGIGCFRDCIGLTSFTVPPLNASNKSVNIDFLVGCYNITTLDLSNVTNQVSNMALQLGGAGSSATYSKLTTVIGMPTTCGKYFYRDSRYMFQYCQYITTITLPTPSETVTDCGVSMFEHSGLTTITTPNNLKTLGNYMFNDCQSLTSVTISADVTKINQNCFSNCPLLTELTYQGTMANWNSITKGNNWKQNTPLTTVHCSDGDITL